MVVVTVTDGDHEGSGGPTPAPAPWRSSTTSWRRRSTGADTAEIPGWPRRWPRACRNLRPPGSGRLRHLGGRHRPVGPPRPASSAWRWPICSAGLATSVPVYGSGGFTTYDDGTTPNQLRTWVDDWAIPRVKIKIGESWGTDPGRDLTGWRWPGG